MSSQLNLDYARRITESLMATVLSAASILGVLARAQGGTNANDVRPRARDIGIHPGVYDPGPKNAITDVAGVLVGQVTIVNGGNIRTGVTAVLPHGGNIFQDKVAAAVFVYNAFGKLVGSTQVNELGQIETPII